MKPAMLKCMECGTRRSSAAVIQSVTPHRSVASEEPAENCDLVPSGRNCLSCGAQMKPAMLKCIECGTRIDGKPGQQTSAATQSVNSERRMVNQSVRATATLERPHFAAKGTVSGGKATNEWTAVIGDDVVRLDRSAGASDRPQQPGNRGADDKYAGLGNDLQTDVNDSKSVASDTSRICQCPCGARFRFPPHMVGMRRRCRKCRKALLLPSDDDSQAHVATGTVAVVANDVLRTAVVAAVTRITTAEPVDNGGLRKTLSSKLIKEYSSNLVVGDVESQSDADRRRLAVLKIGQSHDCRGLELIEPLQTDSAKMVRQAVATAVGELGDPRGVRLALELLCDMDADVIRRSIASLKKLANVCSIRPLLFLGLNEPLLHIQAMEAVVSFGNAGIPELLEIINEKNSLTFRDSVIALGRIGDKQAVPALLMAMNHADAGLRPKIVEALGRLGDRSALRTIIGLLADADENVQLSAVRAVQRIPDMRAVKPIINILHRTKNAELRLQSVVALSTSGNQKAVSILSALLMGADVGLQKAIAESLTNINSPEASETLTRLLDADDLTVLAKALSGLRKNCVPSAIPKLVQYCDHPNEKIRCHAVEALVATKDSGVFNILEQRLLNDASPEIRSAAARGFGKIGDKRSIPLLEQALKDESVVRCSALMSLGSMGDESAVAAMLYSLKDAVPEVRYHAVAGLGKLQADTAVRAIRAMLEDESDIVRVGARKALESLGYRKVEIPLLRRMINRASRLMPDSVAGVIPIGPVLVGLILMISVVGLGWMFTSSSTANVSNNLAVLRASPVDKVFWAPGGTDVVLLRTAGPDDVWDGPTGAFKSKVEAPTLTEYCSPPKLWWKRANSLVAWSPQGARPGDGSIKLPPVDQFELSGNAAFAVYVTKNNQVATWDTAAGEHLKELPLATKPLPKLSSDGSFVAGADKEGNIIVLDRATDATIGLPGDAGSVSNAEDGVFRRMLFSPDGGSLAILRTDRVTLAVISENTMSVRTLNETVSSDLARFASPNAIYSASGTFITQLDLTTGEERRWGVTDQQVDINSLSLSPDESFAVVSAEAKKYGWVVNLTDGSTRELSPAAWPAE